MCLSLCRRQRPRDNQQHIRPFAELISLALPLLFSILESNYFKPIHAYCGQRRYQDLDCMG